MGKVGTFKKNSLCGLSHGASGIAWILYEIAVFFSNKDLMSIAKQAFLYETSHYNTKIKNWPDFRASIQDNESDTLKYPEEDVPSYSSAWCHGAPGIGISRLRMYELTQDKVFLNEARAALRTTIDFQPNTSTNFSLCHGTGGNSYIISYFNKLENNKDLTKIIDSNLRLALEQKEINGKYRSSLHIKTDQEDLSLFNGFTGVAYFYLTSINENAETLDILCPGIRKPSTINKNAFKIANIYKAIYENKYPMTMKVIENLDLKLYHHITSIQIDLEQSKLKSAIKTNIELNIKKSTFRTELIDVFNFENTTIKYDNASRGDSFTYRQDSYNKKNNQLNKLNPTTIIQFNKDYLITKSKWPWSDKTLANGSNFNEIIKKKGEHYTLIRRIPGGTEQFLLTKLNMVIIRNLKIPKTLNKIINIISEHFDEQDVVNLLTTQINILYNTNILIRGREQ
ncbi:lanthionine synthetase LanC family protein [Pedobacter sp. NJ-S-72]